jgi:glycosyltransferase involved in cell wall biosynthesis
VTAPRSILFVHQNFPGQFPRIVEALVARGDRVAAIGSATARDMCGVDLRRWDNDRGTTAGILPAAVRAEADLIRAAAAAREAARLAAGGFNPDVIVANPGWGEPLHLKEVWPDAKLILLAEYWYTFRGGDVGFDPEFTPPGWGLDDAVALNARNMGQALACALADRIVCPTPFQASTFPPALRERIVVHHEGIDLARAARRPDVRVTLPGGRVLDGRRPLVTFVARTLEPLRGFHSFVRALPGLMAEHPDLDVVVIGAADQPGYGASPPRGRSWKSIFLEEVGDHIDPARTHFLGRVTHEQMIAILSRSDAHVYLTYPFTLSWSLLEAMACGCAIIASDTAPVRDVIQAGENGLLVDLFSADAIAAAITQALATPDQMTPLRRAAVTTIRERYDQVRTGTPGWVGLIDELLRLTVWPPSAANQ